MLEISIPENSSPMKLRAVTNADTAAVTQLIDGCLREIGDRVHPDGEGKDLLNPEAAYAKGSGAFVLIEDKGAVIATHAIAPTSEAGTVTFRRIYVRADHRGTGLGKRLMQWAMEECRARGFKRIVFWSDTRFAHAHDFFGSFGFQRGETRDMTDGAMPYSEYRFELEL